MIFFQGQIRILLLPHVFITFKFLLLSLQLGFLVLIPVTEPLFYFLLAHVLQLLLLHNPVDLAPYTLKVTALLLMLLLKVVLGCCSPQLLQLLVSARGANTTAGRFISPLFQYCVQKFFLIYIEYGFIFKQWLFFHGGPQNRIEWSQRCPVFRNFPCIVLVSRKEYHGSWTGFGFLPIHHSVFRTPLRSS